MTATWTAASYTGLWYFLGALLVFFTFITIGALLFGNAISKIYGTLIVGTCKSIIWSQKMDDKINFTGQGDYFDERLAPVIKWGEKLEKEGIGDVFSDLKKK
jgi:hypothetical protein